MVIIASMEVPPEITLWIMARQLLGVGKLECNELNIAKITRALAWLNKRVLLYNFLGITDWRELLNTFRYARANRHGAVFIVDSVMRIGIPDDDYALQGIVAAQFADFSVKQGAHTFLVVHENKGDGRAKDKVRGSKQWTDNAHNVCGMKRNEAKAEKLEELKAENAAGELSNEDFEKKKIGMRKLWDAKFILSKQRWPGSQQNASRWLYFDHEALQFHEQPGDWSFDFTL
jgi:twinkle protein